MLLPGTVNFFTEMVEYKKRSIVKELIVDRIIKDDLSIKSLLGGFTQAQIIKYIKIASEDKATNCVAILLDHQNDRFGSDNLIDGFTLDQLD